MKKLKMLRVGNMQHSTTTISNSSVSGLCNGNPSTWKTLWE